MDSLFRRFIALFLAAVLSIDGLPKAWAAPAAFVAQPPWHALFQEQTLMPRLSYFFGLKWLNRTSAERAVRLQRQTLGADRSDMSRAYVNSLLERFPSLELDDDTQEKLDRQATESAEVAFLWFMARLRLWGISAVTEALAPAGEWPGERRFLTRYGGPEGTERYRKLEHYLRDAMIDDFNAPPALASSALGVRIVFDDSKPQFTSFQRTVVSDDIKRQEVRRLIDEMKDWVPASADVARDGGDKDLLAVLAGRKPATLWWNVETVARSELRQALLAEAERRGFTIQRSPHIATRGDPPSYVYVIGHARPVKAIVQIYAEISEFRRLFDAEADREIGRNLGYPEAAIDAYIQNSDPRDKVKGVLSHLGYVDQGEVAPLSNMRFYYRRGDKPEVILFRPSDGALFSTDTQGPRADWLERAKPITPNQLVELSFPGRQERVRGKIILKHPATILANGAGAIGLAVVDHMEVKGERLLRRYRPYARSGEVKEESLQIVQQLPDEYPFIHSVNQLLMEQSESPDRTRPEQAQWDLVSELLEWGMSQSPLIVEYEKSADPESPLSSGDASVIAMSSLLWNNRVARTHELFEARLRGFETLNERQGYLQRILNSLPKEAQAHYERHVTPRLEGKSLAPADELAIRFHYAVRAFTREVFPEEDEDLTRLIKGRPLRGRQEPTVIAFGGTPLPDRSLPNLPPLQVLSAFHRLYNPELQGEKIILFSREDPNFDREGPAYGALTALGLVEKTIEGHRIAYSLVRRPTKAEYKKIKYALLLMSDVPDDVEIRRTKQRLTRKVDTDEDPRASRQANESLRQFLIDLALKAAVDSSIVSVESVSGVRVRGSRGLGAVGDTDPLQIITLHFLDGLVMTLERNDGHYWGVHYRQLSSWPVNPGRPALEELDRVIERLSNEDRILTGRLNIPPAPWTGPVANLPLLVAQTVYGLNQAHWPAPVRWIARWGMEVEMAVVGVWVAASLTGWTDPIVTGILLVVYGLLHVPFGIFLARQSASRTPLRTHLTPLAVFAGYGIALWSAATFHPYFLAALPILGLWQYGFDARLPFEEDAAELQRKLMAELKTYTQRVAGHDQHERPLITTWLRTDMENPNFNLRQRLVLWEGALQEFPSTSFLPSILPGEDLLVWTVLLFVPLGFREAVLRLAGLSETAALLVLAAMGLHNRAFPGTGDDEYIAHIGVLSAALIKDYEAASEFGEDPLAWSLSHRSDLGLFLSGLCFFGSEGLLESALGSEDDAPWREVLALALALHAPEGKPIPAFLHRFTIMFGDDLVQAIADWNHGRPQKITLRQALSGDPAADEFWNALPRAASDQTPEALNGLRRLARFPASDDETISVEPLDENEWIHPLDTDTEDVDLLRLWVENNQELISAELDAMEAASKRSHSALEDSPEVEPHDDTRKKRFRLPPVLSFKLYSELMPDEQKDPRLVSFLDSYWHGGRDAALWDAKPIGRRGLGLMRKQARDALVAYDGRTNEPLGVYAFMVGKNNPDVIGTGIVVSKESRRLGVAMQLRDALFQHLRERGYKKFIIGPPDHTREAQGFNQTLGNKKGVSVQAHDPQLFADRGIFSLNKGPMTVVSLEEYRPTFHPALLVLPLLVLAIPLAILYGVGHWMGSWETLIRLAHFDQRDLYALRSFVAEYPQALTWFYTFLLSLVTVSGFLLLLSHVSPKSKGKAGILVVVAWTAFGLLTLKAISFLLPEDPKFQDPEGTTYDVYLQRSPPAMLAAS